MEQGVGKDEWTERKMGGVDISTPLAYFVLRPSFQCQPTLADVGRHAG